MYTWYTYQTANCLPIPLTNCTVISKKPFNHRQSARTLSRSSKSRPKENNLQSHATFDQSNLEASRAFEVFSCTTYIARSTLDQNVAEKLIYAFVMPFLGIN